MLVIQRPTVEAIDDEDGTRQRFAVGPLEPGFGHTIGNSLRRTLLSSIPGAAITQVRFDHALHEFDTIAGVTEDVTDVILNLKDVVLISHSDEPVNLRLDVRGPADVTAKDIQASADIEILTPDLHVATLNGKGRIALDLTVERGRGYLAADAGRTTATIGVIPIDAIFSPVRRVSFNVEPTRVEQSTNYDRLVLDIETDGALSPREALAAATNNYAIQFGWNELGQIAPGRRADILVVDADPTASVWNVRRISTLILEGNVLDREGLLRFKK